MTIEERRDASSLIVSAAIDLVLKNRWSIIHTYISFRSEVNTYPFVERMTVEDRKIIVPWVEADGSLSHHELRSLSELTEGTYGIPHPPRNEVLDLSSIDAVFLPIASFDRAGNRLGYGKGFYDKFLQRLGPGAKRVGLAFAKQEAVSIPAMPHDEPLHLVITENEIIQTQR